MIEAKSICDSINPQGSRLLTMYLRYPKFIHQESLRHRTLYIHDCLYDPDFSFSVSSARAIPFSKLIQEIESDELRAKPEFWGSEQKGMSPGNELDPKAKEIAQLWWKRSALAAATNARSMAKSQGLSDAMPWEIPHKSIVNRIIEPYIHVNCLVTGTNRGWMNFFGLRLDRAADPTLQILAQNAWKTWNESQPKLLYPNEWHLPYIDSNIEPVGLSGELLQISIKISAARCARLSYLSFSTNKLSTIEENLELYNKLIGGEIIHASPLEHQATPDTWDNTHVTFEMCNDYEKNHQNNWKNFHQSGNLGSGWRQYRKMLPNESIAPLPKEYQK